MTLKSKPHHTPDSVALALIKKGRNGATTIGYDIRYGGSDKQLKNYLITSI